LEGGARVSTPSVEDSSLPFFFLAIVPRTSELERPNSSSSRARILRLGYSSLLLIVRQNARRR